MIKGNFRSDISIENIADLLTEVRPYFEPKLDSAHLYKRPLHYRRPITKTTGPCPLKSTASAGTRLTRK